MDKTYIVKGCKGPHALTGPLLACTYSTQHWNSTQHTYNHTCSRTVQVLHTRVVAVGVKNPLIHHQNTNMFSPKSYNPGVQNIYCSAACMIVCVLRGTPVLGATCACQEWSSKGIWTLTVPHTRRLI